MKLFAEIVSLIFNPVLFLSTIPFFVMYRLSESGRYALKWQVFSSAFIFLGIVLFLIAIKKGIFSDLDITKREERKLFYLVAIILITIYLAIAVIFKGVLFSMSIAALGVMIGILIFDFVNKYMKPSIHMGAACAWITSIGVLYGFSAFLSLVWIIPLLAWSRLYLKRHSTKEVFTGSILGITITLATAIVGKIVL